MNKDLSRIIVRKYPPRRETANLLPRVAKAVVTGIPNALTDERSGTFSRLVQDEDIRYFAASFTTFFVIFFIFLA